MAGDSSREHRARGRRLVLRFAGVQLACTLAAALAALALAGPRAAAAALAGGAIVVAGNVMFGWRLFAPGIAPVPVLARGLWAGELLKWAWLGLALYGALGPGQLQPLPLLAGLMAAQLGFWLGLALIR